MATLTPFSTLTVTSRGPSSSEAVTSVASSWMASLTWSKMLNWPGGSGVVLVKLIWTVTPIVPSSGRTSYAAEVSSVYSAAAAGRTETAGMANTAMTAASRTRIADRRRIMGAP